MEAHGFRWILYPYFESRTGYEVPLSDVQWIVLGQSLKAVHTTVLPPELEVRLPREDYSGRGRDIVREFDRRLDTYASKGEAVSARLAAFWLERRADIRAMVERYDRKRCLGCGKHHPS